MLVGVRLEENGVERGDDRRFQFAQQRQQVAAGRPAENSELVLDRDNVHVAGVQEVGGAPVRIQVLLLNLEANDVRIPIAPSMSLTGTAKHRLWGCRAATAPSRSEVNVAMPHLRGK